MAKIENGTLAISAAYGVKVPGAADFSSQEARLAIDLTFPVNGEYDTIVDQADVLEAALVTQLKLAVFAQLGLGVSEAEDGSIQPDFSTLPARSSAGSGGGKGGGGGGKSYGGNRGGSGGGSGGSKAAAAGVDIPKYDVTIDGAQITVQDLRDLKTQGVYKPSAPDFRVGDNAYWLVSKDGSINQKAQKLAEAVAAHAPFTPNGGPDDDSGVW